MNTLNAKSSMKNFLKNYIMYVILLALIIFFATQNSAFISLSNLRNILNSSAYQIIVGVGVAFIMLSGAIDLSTGYQISTIGVVCGMLMTNTSMPFGWVMVIGIALGVIFSLINGIIYVIFDTFPFMITLATQYILWGLSFIISKSNSSIGFPEGFKFIGQGYIGPVPFAIGVMIICVIFGAIVLNRTYFGRYVYGLGSNPQAIQLAGVNIKKMKLAIFALAGFFTALGTLMLISRAGSSSSTMGPGIEFTIIAGCMLGGIKMGGGGGKISSVIIGMLILTVLSNGMQLMQLGVYPQKVAMGVVLLVAIGFDVFQSKNMLKAAKLVKGEAPVQVKAE